jgi:pilus assembly protein CpaF
LARMETMISMASLNLPDKAMRQQIASAIDVVVQVSRMSDGTRKIMSVSEVVGMEGDVVTMQDIFVFERVGIGEKGKVLGRFRPTGIRPKFAERLKYAGIHLPASMFDNVTEYKR